MTKIGQILVVFVTFFAVLFMGFAVTVYSTRTNWRDKWTKLKTEKDELDLKKKSLELQVKGLSDDLLAEVTRHQAEKKTSQQLVTDQKINYDRLLEDAKQAKKDLVEANARLKLAVDEASNRRAEAAAIRKMWETTQEEKEKAMKKQFETEQQFIELKGNYETLEARAKDLEQRSAELTAILVSHGLPIESKDKEELRRTNPPPVEGIVLEVDKEGKFVKISIGSDSGLIKLHRLDVYRLNPKGKYVGKIELVQVDPDKAVGRILTQFKQGNIQEGDLVATRITASR